MKINNPLALILVPFSLLLFVPIRYLYLNQKTGGCKYIERKVDIPSKISEGEIEFESSPTGKLARQSIPQVFVQIRETDERVCGESDKHSSGVIRSVAMVWTQQKDPVTHEKIQNKRYKIVAAYKVDCWNLLACFPYGGHSTLILQDNVGELWEISPGQMYLDQVTSHAGNGEKKYPQNFYTTFIEKSGKSYPFKPTKYIRF